MESQVGLREPGEEVDALAAAVIGAAIEVHRVLGPGFVESVYEAALCVELELRRIPFRRRVPITLAYKHCVVGHHQMDLLIGERLVVELKAVESLVPIHALQVRSYLAATGLTLGLLINFNAAVLLSGVRRVVLTKKR
jgi:GxxExxY protein